MAASIVLEWMLANRYRLQQDPALPQANFAHKFSCAAFREAKEPRLPSNPATFDLCTAGSEMGPRPQRVRLRREGCTSG